MIRTVISVHGDDYGVSGTAAVDAFREATVAAVRAGGDLVRLDHDAGSVELLITPSTPLRLYRVSSSSPILESPPPRDYLDLEFL